MRFSEMAIKGVSHGQRAAIQAQHRKFQHLLQMFLSEMKELLKRDIEQKSFESRVRIKHRFIIESAIIHPSSQ